MVQAVFCLEAVIFKSIQICCHCHDYCYWRNWICDFYTGIL